MRKKIVSQDDYSKRNNDIFPKYKCPAESWSTFLDRASWLTCSQVLRAVCVESHPEIP
jgi:hypothetical protein